MKLHLKIIFSYFAIHFWSKDFQVAYTFDILNVFAWHFFVISYLHRQNEMIGWNENQKYSVIPSYLFYTGCIFDPICIHNGVHHIENSVFLLLCTTSCHHHHHVLLLQFYFRVTVLVKMSSRTHTHTPKYVFPFNQIKALFINTIVQCSNISIYTEREENWQFNWSVTVVIFTLSIIENKVKDSSFFLHQFTQCVWICIVCYRVLVNSDISAVNENVFFEERFR